MRIAERSCHALAGDAERVKNRRDSTLRFVKCAAIGLAQVHGGEDKRDEYEGKSEQSSLRLGAGSRQA